MINEIDPCFFANNQLLEYSFSFIIEKFNEILSNIDSRHFNRNVKVKETLFETHEDRTEYSNDNIVPVLDGTQVSPVNNIPMLFAVLVVKEMDFESEKQDKVTFL
jgi:hypothetical protein